MVDASNPFCDQTPKQILTRQYKLSEFSITPAWGGTNFSFPKDLYEFPAISKALSSFYYMRANVTIMVKINSTPYHQGMMMLAWEPDCPAARSWDLYSASALSPVTLNYSTSDSVTLNFNWMCPELYCTTVYQIGQGHAIGKLFMYPLVPISNNSGGPETITCSVYAAFQDPETAGFINQPLSQSGQGRMVSKEAKDKAETGTLVKQAPSISLAPLFEEIPILGPLYDVAKTILQDKPTSLQSGNKMIMDYATDQVYGRGTDNSIRLSIYPNSILSTQNLFKGVSTNSTWSELAQQPMLHDLKDFVLTTDTMEVSVHPAYFSPATGSVYQPDYLMVVSSLFRYWRGSIRYFFQFVTNAWTTARFRLSYAIDPTETNFSEGGDFPNVIIDVKGSTNYAVTIPFLAPTVYRQRSAPFTNISASPFPKLRLELISAVVAQAGDPLISVVLWRAGGNDIQFHEEQISNLDVVTSQCSIQDEFKSRFSGITCDTKLSRESGYCASNYGFKISDSMKKYSTFPVGLILPSNAPPNHQAVWNVNQETFRTHTAVMYALTKYKRGSTRYKFFTTTGTERYIAISNTASWQEENLSVFVPIDQTPIISVEIPFHAAHIYLSGVQDTYATFLNQEGGIASVPSNQVAYTRFSIGDDFQAGFLFPPPKLITTFKRKVVLAKTAVQKQKLRESESKQLYHKTAELDLNSLRPQAKTTND